MKLLLVQDLISTRTNMKATMRKGWVLLTTLDSGPLALWLGRLAVASYYCNLVAEEMEVWVRLKDEPPVKLRWPEEGFAEFKFPYLAVRVLYQCTLVLMKSSQDCNQYPQSLWCIDPETMTA